MAILAALTAAEAGEVDIGRLDRALSHIEAPLKESLERHLIDERNRVYPGQPKGTAIPEELQEARRQYKENRANLQVRTSDYVLALLRYYRPDFDDLPHKKKLALIKEGCERINALLGALRQLGAFLEYEDTKPPIKDAQRYVTAAEMHDVEGLSTPKIAHRMGVTPTRSERDKGEVKKIREWIGKGRELLANLLGEEGWQEEVKRKRAQMERWNSYSEEERTAIKFAEEFGMTIEVARSWAEELGSTRKQKLD
jgi:hypothetical protein